jgi:hypothetical protein
MTTIWMIIFGIVGVIAIIFLVRELIMGDKPKWKK